MNIPFGDKNVNQTEYYDVRQRDMRVCMCVCVRKKSKYVYRLDEYSNGVTTGVKP